MCLNFGEMTISNFLILKIILQWRITEIITVILSYSL